MNDNVFAAAKARLGQMTSTAPQTGNWDETRYVWFAPFGLAHNDTGPIPRLRWFPVTRVLRWDNILSKENQSEFVATRNLVKPNDRPTEGAYWIKPGAIANSLNLQYGEWGMADSVVFRGREVETVEKLGVNELFFPEDADALPKTYRETKARIEEVLGKIETGALEGAAPGIIKAIRDVAAEMLASLERTRIYMQNHIADRHAEMEKAKTDTTGKFRGAYDQKDRNFLAWLEIAPRDEALNSMAVNNNALVQLAEAQLRQSQQPQQPLLDENSLHILGKAIAMGLAEANKPAPQQNNNQKK